MKASSTTHLNSNGRGAWTIFELFFVIFIVFVPFLVWKFVALNHGVWAGTGAAILSAAVAVSAATLHYRAFSRRRERHQRKLKEKYPGVYRVLALPTGTDKNIQTSQGAEIKVGDYGWEAVPIREDGLIYLQGLTVEWCVVWYAGFRADQIEHIAPKPRSQYDWDYAWAIKHPPCPFPVQERETTNMGLPLAPFHW